MAGTETEDDLSTARSTTEAEDDYTILPNGLIVTRIVQIWPIRSREAPIGTKLALSGTNSDIRMWMGEVRVDGAKIGEITSSICNYRSITCSEEPCYVKLRAACKARWRPFWSCRNSHSTIEPRGVRYIQFEFPEPALDHLQLNLIADQYEVKILLERMPGTETFLWKDTTDLRRILLARLEAIRKQRELSEPDIDTYLETAYSPTPLSDYEEDEEGSGEEKANEESALSGVSKHSRSGWALPRRGWSDGTNSLRIPEKVQSVILDREPEVLAAVLSPALLESLRTALSSCGGSQRGTLFAMVHSVVLDCLKEEGVDKVGEVWKEIQRSYGTTPFVDTVLNRLEKSLEREEIRTDNTCSSSDSVE